jgi:tetratricopeptide (TPR) repeat protein/Cdc6-like AAA superfamily ATPase
MSDYVLIDFSGPITSAEKMLGQGMLAEAATEASKVIATALKELYLQEVMRLSFVDRQQVLNDETDYRTSRNLRKDKPVFQMGNWIGLLEMSVFLPKWTDTFHADATLVQRFMSEVNAIGKMRNEVIHDGKQTTRIETENLIACARSISEIITSILAKHHTFDYKERIENADRLMQQGLLNAAATSCCTILEVALRDLYIRDVMRLSYGNRSAMIEQEKKYRESKSPIDRSFTMTDWIIFYKKNWKLFSDSWIRDNKTDRNALGHMEIDLGYLDGLRLKIVKENFQPSRDEADWLFNLTKLVIRTFKLIPPLESPQTAPPTTDLLLTNDSEDIHKLFKSRELFQIRPKLADDFVKAVRENPVTYLIGPTGYGKTRLLWEVRNELGRSKGIWIDCEKMASANQCVEYITEEIRDFDIILDSQETQLSSFLLDFDGLLILDNFEYCLASSENSDKPLGRIQHWIKDLSADFSIADKYAWLNRFIEQAKLNLHSPLRIVILSQIVPHSYVMQNREIDIALYPLDDAQSIELLQSLDKNNKLPKDPDALQRIAEYCSGIPSALEIVVTLAHTMAEAKDVMRFIGDPIFTEMRADQKLTNLINELLDRFKGVPEVIVLRSLALLGMRFKKGHVSPDREQPGVARLARMLFPNITQQQVHSTLNTLVKMRFIVKYVGEARLEDEFVLPPLFGRAILETVSSLPAREQLTSYGSLAIFLGNVLESFPTQSARSSKVVLESFYKLQTHREQAIVSRWLWATLKRHQVVETLHPLEIRRSAHAVLVAISSFAAKLHFWWTMYVPLDAYGQILKRVENALDVAEDLTERADPKREAFFAAAHDLVKKWTLLEQNYPRESGWTCAIDLHRANEVLGYVASIRQILKRYYHSSANRPSMNAKLTEESWSTTESAERPEAENMLLSDYTAILTDYQDVLAILSHLEGEMYRHLERHEEAIQKQNEAIATFSENMNWGKPYLFYSRAESEFPLGKQDEGFQSCIDAIKEAADDVEVLAWSWKDIGVELLNAQCLSSALKAFCLAVAYSFRQLPNPSYGGPIYRVDAYNIVLYKHMCDLLALAFRQAYSIDKDVKRHEFVDFQELWENAIAAADQAKNEKTGHPVRKGDRTPSTIEARDQNKCPSPEKLLDGWKPQEEYQLCEAGTTLRTTYDAIAVRLNLPRTPGLDLGEYENPNEYFAVNKAMWEAMEGSLEAMKKQVETKIADLLSVKI